MLNITLWYWRYSERGDKDLLIKVQVFKGERLRLYFSAPHFGRAELLGYNTRHKSLKQTPLFLNFLENSWELLLTLLFSL